MHPIHQLRKLLKEPSTNQGRVIRSNESSMVIATPKGSLSVTRSIGDATRYQVGDTVLLANGVVVGKRQRQPTVYVV